MLLKRQAAVFLLRLLLIGAFLYNVSKYFLSLFFAHFKNISFRLKAQRKGARANSGGQQSKSARMRG
jgi:hypothetical protein